MSRRWTATVIALLVTVGGCAIDAHGQVNRIDDNDVPFQLLDPTAREPADQPGDESKTVCILDRGKLVEVDRRVKRGADLRDLIGALASVTTQEAAQGYHTAFAGPVDIERVQVRGGTAAVDLHSDADEAASGDPMATVAQIVCTLTAQPGIGSVKFSLAGDALEVPTAKGTLTSSPVSRDDYSSLFRR